MDILASTLLSTFALTPLKKRQLRENKKRDLALQKTVILLDSHIFYSKLRKMSTVSQPWQLEDFNCQNFPTSLARLRNIVLANLPAKTQVLFSPLSTDLLNSSSGLAVWECPEGEIGSDFTLLLKACRCFSSNRITKTCSSVALKDS